jgi:hypothetical protein
MQGIEVTRVELTDVKLPQNIQRAMGQEAEATRKAKGKVSRCIDCSPKFHLIPSERVDLACSCVRM